MVRALKTLRNSRALDEIPSSAERKIMSHSRGSTDGITYEGIRTGSLRQVAQLQAIYRSREEQASYLAETRAWPILSSRPLLFRKVEVFAEVKAPRGLDRTQIRSSPRQLRKHFRINFHLLRTSRSRGSRFADYR